MTAFLTWLQASALGAFVRDSGPWTYPLINLAHILGIATLFGAVLVMDLALLGGTRKRPSATLAAVTHMAAPVAAGGFLLAAASGIGLLSSNGTDYIGNPFFLIKFPAIALGLINAALVNRSAAWRALRAGVPTSADLRRLRWTAMASLACWLTAISMGRMIGYW